METELVDQLIEMTKTGEGTSWLDKFVAKVLRWSFPRKPAPWLDGTEDPDAKRVILRAMMDLGIAEMPLGSNRSPRIDEYNRAAGVPEELIRAGKAYWCCSWATAMDRECGLPTAGKGKDGSCDEVMKWCKATGRWSKAPSLGAYAFYGTPQDAHHVSKIVRLNPLLEVGGNQKLGGSFSRDNACRNRLIRCFHRDRGRKCDHREHE